MNKLRFLALPIGLLWLAAHMTAAGHPMGPQNREKLRENLSTLRLLRMTQTLDLTEEQTAKIYPAVNRLEKERLELQKQMSSQIDDLRVFLKQETPEQGVLVQRIKTIRGLKSAIKAKEEEIEASLDAHLTVIQRARYVLFSVDFYRSLGERLQRYRRLR